MHIHYALKEGFINLVIGEEMEDGGTPITFWTQDNSGQYDIVDKDDGTYLVGKNGLTGEIPFSTEQAKKHAISQEVFDELVQVMKDGKYIPLNAGDFK